MTGMMTEGGRGRVRGRRGMRVLGGGRSDGPQQEARGCLYVYVTSQPKPQPVCIDRVQTECLYQSFMRPPLGTHCLPAHRDSPLSGPLSSTKGAGREQFPHQQSLPHWARMWTNTGGSALSKKGETITNMLSLRLASHGLIAGTICVYASSYSTPLHYPKFILKVGNSVRVC